MIEARAAIATVIEIGIGGGVGAGTVIGAYCGGFSSWATANDM